MKTHTEWDFCKHAGIIAIALFEKAERESGAHHLATKAAYENWVRVADKWICRMPKK